MISLADPIWKEFEGGYKTCHDASIPLKSLELCAERHSYQLILGELWDNLIHQGDIGMASLMAVPHLIQIEKEKQLGDWKILGLIVSIEIARLENTLRLEAEIEAQKELTLFDIPSPTYRNTPVLPKEHEQRYLKYFSQIVDIIAFEKKAIWSGTYACCALAAIALSKGQVQIAKVVFQLSNPDLTKKNHAISGGRELIIVCNKF